MICRPYGTVKRWLREGLPHRKYGRVVTIDPDLATAWVLEHRTPDFWTRVSKTPGCWLWTGYVDSRGHGQISVNGVETKAHRRAWELVRGPLPKGARLVNKCGEPACVNPACWFLASGHSGKDCED